MERGCGTSGSPRARPGSPPPGYQSGVRELLGNPGLSFEDKVQLVLARISQDTDGEALEIMDRMKALSERKTDAKDPKVTQKLDQDMEQLQLRLQKCMERRKAMFELASTLSRKHSEMAFHAIQNMGR